MKGRKPSSGRTPNRGTAQSAQKNSQKTGQKTGQKTNQFAGAKTFGRSAQRSPAGAVPKHASKGAPRTHQQRPPRDSARWVIGIHSCEETLKVRPKTIRELWLREKWEDSQQLRELAEKAERLRIAVHAKSVGVLEKLGSGHQGVALAVTESPQANWDELQIQEKALVLVLDGIEDPHNLGSILRTAWLTGVAAVVIPEDRAVGLTPTVCKIASGGAEHVPVESITNLPSFIEDLKKWGFWTYGLSEKGQRKPWDFKLDGRVAWVVGSEGSGLRIPTERACDELVRIPQASTGSSYNAGIAAAMALMETCRQFDILE